MNKSNCWEFKRCGREPRGARSGELGVCPVATDARLDGTHQGVNAGRACWVVAGSLCEGQRQGTFAQKFSNCQECDFYKAVREEEGGDFQLSITLLNKLKSSWFQKLAQPPLNLDSPGTTR